MPREEADRLDSRVLKAGIAMAIGMTLLIPTFNAINNSYIEVSEVPSWMPPPDKLPENFRPPEDFKPPEDWTPPPDWEPPEGWEDWEPPEDWEGKMEGFPPPPGSCPPPVIKRPSSANVNHTVRSPSWSTEVPFDVPEYTLGIEVWANWTDWRASEIRGSITSPNGNAFGAERSKTAQGSGQLVLTTPAQSPHSMHWKWDPREHNNELPEHGSYTIILEADPVNSIQDGGTASGNVQVETYLVLPCGGAFQ